MPRALPRLGFAWEAYEYFAFLMEALLGGGIQIMYGLGGELSHNGLVLRYRVDATDDGLEGKKGRSRSARSGWSRPWR